MLTRLLLVSLLLSAGAPLAAHHADTNYDLANDFSLTGVVTEFRFVNPHLQITFEVTDPTIDLAYFPETPAGARYWTSSADLEQANRAWTVYFDDGRMGAEPLTNESLVRCVRWEP